MNGKLGSRKLWAAAIAAVMVFVEQMFGVELSQTEWAAQLAPFLAYIGGESLADAFRRK